jgi:hypothetical protein
MIVHPLPKRREHASATDQPFLRPSISLGKRKQVGGRDPGIVLEYQLLGLLA